MPDLVAIHASTIPEEHLPPDLEVTSDGLIAAVRDLAARGVNGTVLYRSPAGWFAFAALRARDGKLAQHAIELSTAPEGAPPVDARPAPDVAIAVDIRPARFADLFARVAAEEESFRAHDAPDGGGSVTLPFAYRTARSACEALAIVAKRMRAASVRLVVEVDGAFFLAVLTRHEGARLAGLHAVSDDDDVIALAQLSIESAPAPIERTCPPDDRWLAPATDDA